LRILLLSDYSDSSGGVEQLLENLRGELRRLGHQVCWLSSSASTQSPPIADRVCFGTTSRLRGLIQLANPGAALALRKAIGEFQPDVIHVAMFLTQLSPAILPVLASVPTLYHAQWYRSICLTGTRVLPSGEACRQRAGLACLRSGCVPVQDWIPLAGGLQLLRYWAKSFRLVVANSEYVKTELNAWGLRADCVIPCAVEYRPARPPLEDPPLAVFAGRLVREKGAHILIEAWQAVKGRARLLVAGDGPQREALRRMSGSNVEFTGHISRAEMEARFARAWVQVVPSIWHEPFGLTAAEAQMRGTAVIASDSGGLPEVVTPGRTGLLTRPGDAAGLTAALEQLLTDRTAAEAMGQAGRLAALRRFSLETFASRFLEAYRAIMT
jgi:glycosyltransferase involved in cell wall biosynthesis